MNRVWITAKTARFLRLVGLEPGITAAEVHRRIGKDYAHGSHQFTYATLKRMRKNGLIERIAPRGGLRGIGFRVAVDAIALFREMGK